VPLFPATSPGHRATCAPAGRPDLVRFSSKRRRVDAFKGGNCFPGEHNKPKKCLRFMMEAL
jgi:hypothetical protein